MREAPNERLAPIEAAGDPQAGERDDELLGLSRLLDALRPPVAHDQPREIVAPTWLLAPVIRAATSEAIERLVTSVDVFRQQQHAPTPDELRAALDTASRSRR